VPGRDVVRAFPGRKKIEVTPLLHQLYRLVDHPLLQLIPAYLDVTGQRKILAQRKTLKPIIGEYSPQIGMSGKQDAVHIEGFPLEPIGRQKNRDGGWHSRGFAGFDFDPDTPVLLDRQQMIDDVKAPRTVWIIGAANIYQQPEPALGIVAQPGQYRDDLRRF